MFEPFIDAIATFGTLAARRQGASLLHHRFDGLRLELLQARDVPDLVATYPRRL